MDSADKVMIALQAIRDFFEQFQAEEIDDPEDLQVQAAENCDKWIETISDAIQYMKRVQD